METTLLKSFFLITSIGLPMAGGTPRNTVNSGHSTHNTVSCCNNTANIGAWPHIGGATCPPSTACINHNVRRECGNHHGLTGARRRTVNV